MEATQLAAGGAGGDEDVNATQPASDADKLESTQPAADSGPKLGSRARRALLERPAAGSGHWLGEEVGVEGVPPGPLPGASAGPSDLAPGDRRPSSDASGSYSEEGSECGDWRDDPGLRGLSASEDGSECDGWRRELGSGEMCENYMDAKFRGEDADMAESQRS